MAKFDINKKGYDTDQVDSFINKLSIKYEEKLSEQKDRVFSLKNELSVMEERLEAYKDKLPQEIFTTPERGKADGLLVATKPLSWQGTLIEDFSIRFENGRAVEVKAAKGQEALERMISMDENAAFLGECALISWNSPINNTGILFYNTLFDENACCHLALGRGFDNCVKDYEKYSQQELREMGVNDSMIHVDFMIGSKDLEITGITEEGDEVEIFRNGVWCF